MNQSLKYCFLMFENYLFFVTIQFKIIKKMKIKNFILKLTLEMFSKYFYSRKKKIARKSLPNSHVAAAAVFVELMDQPKTECEK